MMPVLLVPWRNNLLAYAIININLPVAGSYFSDMKGKMLAVVLGELRS
jgi:hypothetical protein